MSARSRDTVFSSLDSRQGGEGRPGLFLADFRQVQIDHGRFEGGVAEVGGDLPHACPGLQHVRRVAVAQGVDADLLMAFHQAALVFGDAHGRLHAGGGHGFGGVMECAFEGASRAVPTAPGGGEEPVGIAVPFPKKAQPVDECGAQWHFARLAALGVPDAQDVALAVDVLGVDVERFAHAQAAVIDEGEVGAVAVVAEGAQQKGDIFTDEDVGQRLLAVDSYLRPDLP